MGTACEYAPSEPIDPADPDPTAGIVDEADQALVAMEPTVSTTTEREPLVGVGGVGSDGSDTAPATTGPHEWRFAVLSDMHLPNPRSAVIEREVAALTKMGVRFVVITGDDTNGSAIVDHRKGRVNAWWATITGILAPLRDAGIPVLPIAGNHDTYLAWQREGYETAFGDLEHWAAPLEVHAANGKGYARAPYSYSVDVDGVHLSLANIVDQNIDRDVSAWLTEDLASPAATSARVRMVFGHVPLFSIVRKPKHGFVEQFGSILARGKADFYVAGHEHLTWDESFAIGAANASAMLRQVMVGCASGFYVFAPSKAARERAGCAPGVAGSGVKGELDCTMPNGGKFEIVRDRSQRMIEHDSATFTVFTVSADGDASGIQVTPMTVDEAGEARAFYLKQ